MWCETPLLVRLACFKIPRWERKKARADAQELTRIVRAVSKIAPVSASQLRRMSVSLLDAQLPRAASTQSLVSDALPHVGSTQSLRSELVHMRVSGPAAPGHAARARVSAKEKVRLAARKIGANAFLKKPFKIEDLLSALP